MNPGDSTSKISLSMLRGKSSNQSVPSISFRFNPASEDLKEVYEFDEKDETISSSILPETASDNEKKSSNNSSDTSPSRKGSHSLNQRSSSLDGSSGPVQEASPKSLDAGSLISRFTKTVEDKINEIRSDKVKDKDPKSTYSRESKDFSEQEENSSEFTNVSVEKYSITGSSSSKRSIFESKERPDVSASPSRTKTTLVQDFAEQTNKIKTEFNKSLGPKITELRNRKNSKEGSSSSKTRNSILNSLLGREDSIGSDNLFHECHAVDTAIEAHEDVQYVEEIRKKSLSSINKSMGSGDVPEEVDAVKKENIIQHECSCSLLKSQKKNFDIKNSFSYFIHEIWVTKKTLTTRCTLLIFVLCFVLPLPRFFAGVLFGAALSSFAFLFLLHLVLPSPEDEFSLENSPNEFDVLLENQPLGLCQGWMNELDGDYFPESYHVSQTHTVLLRLMGCILQVDHSRKKINKHARPNENLQCGSFVHHREYDLSGCEIVLLPNNLPRKWLWSRKYPLLIKLKQKSLSSPAGSVASTPTKFQKESSPKHQLSEQESSQENAEQMENSRLAEYDIMNSSIDLDSYEEVTQDMCLETSLCLFARTDREKDDWYRRFVRASESVKNADYGSQNIGSLHDLPRTVEAEIPVPFESPTVEGISESVDENVVPLHPTEPLTFEKYMTRLVQQEVLANPGVSWFNALFGRVFFDFLHDQFWANKIQERIQRKLSKLHIPYFVGEIVVSGVEIGNSVPQLLKAEPPKMDNRGLWIDFSVQYSGSFTMILETKVDLMKLKAKSGLTSSNPPSPNEGPTTTTATSAQPSRTRAYSRSPSSDCVLRNVQFDTDTDDSVESSSEEDGAEEDIGEKGLVSSAGGPASRRFLRIVDTVAASRYFQQASEWRVLQRAMRGVSNTRIELGVEVRRLAGTLTLNVPPAPADRLWYGFRGSPELVMVARPRLGDRQLNLPFLAEFIQKQLRTVFEKVFVLPNMDDIVIPIMSPILPGQKASPRPPWDSRLSSSPAKNSTAFELGQQSFLRLVKSEESFT